MKFVLYGDGLTPGSGGWCYAETLQEMGHIVIRTSEQHLLDRYTQPQWRFIRKIFNHPLESHRLSHVGALVDLVRCERPDIVIILKGIHISRRDVALMKSTGAWVVIINHDDFFSRNSNNWSRIQRDAIPEYDFVFVTRKVNVGDVRSLNPRVEFFPFAYFPRIHRPTTIPVIEMATWKSDVSFIGTWESERCQLLEYLVAHVTARYAIWGNQWEKVRRSSPLRPFIQGRSAMMYDFAKAIGGSEISLGFLRKKNRDEYTQRSFEIPACGGLLLAERTPTHVDLYQEGTEAEFFDPANPEELAQKVTRLMENAELRRSIQKAGTEAVASKNATYYDRLTELIRIYRTTRPRSGL